MAEKLAPHLPTRAPQMPQMMEVSGGVHSVVEHRKPIWHGNVRIVVDGDLITVEKRTGSNTYVELWRSDVPYQVPPR